jgi:hypothetical protein
MARRRTLAEVWMGTPNEVEFLSSYISCEAHILYEKSGRI